MPHCLWLTQALPVSNIAATITNAHGLKTCFPFMRIIYLDKIDTNAANMATHKRFAFKQ